MALDLVVRAEILSIARRHPELSNREIASMVGVTHRTVAKWLHRSKATSSLADRHRAGRKKLVSPAVADFLEKQLLGPGASSTVELANLVSSRLKVSISPQTIHRHLKQVGCRFGTPKRTILLTPRHKKSRLLWAKQHLSKKTSFAIYMFTDSKIFLLSDVHCGGRIWWPKGRRPQVAVAKKTQGVHVYIGVTKYGITKPCFVTGAGSQVSEYVKVNSNKRCSGVCAQEYCEVVLPHLIEGGNALFRVHPSKANTWVFQQDNAPIHKAGTTTTLLNQELPGRWMQDWPPQSPDLSWVENIWAVSMRRLQQVKGSISSIDDLKRELTVILASIEHDILKSFVRGIPDRLEKVIAADGGPITTD